VEAGVFFFLVGAGGVDVFGVALGAGEVWVVVDVHLLALISDSVSGTGASIWD